MQQYHSIHFRNNEDHSLQFFCFLHAVQLFYYTECPGKLVNLHIFQTQFLWLKIKKNTISYDFITTITINLSQTHIQ